MTTTLEYFETIQKQIDAANQQLKLLNKEWIVEHVVEHFRVTIIAKEGDNAIVKLRTTTPKRASEFLSGFNSALLILRTI
jgi:DNA-binding FrmR family transcriptional regulator